MKRVLSTLLALTMLLSCFLVIPVSAETSAALYSKDYTQLYQEKGLTEATDATTMTDLGVSLFLTGNAQTDYPTQSYTQLTEDGLEISSRTQAYRGFVFDVKDHLPQIGNSYLIQMTMRFNEITTSGYPFFGYGFNKDATTWDVFTNTNNRQQMRYNNKVDGVSRLLINGFDSSDNMFHLWDAVYLYNQEAVYQFVVENNKLTKVLISYLGTVYTYTATTANIDASGGDFVLSLRTDGGKIAKITLKDIAVLNADQLLTNNPEQLENTLATGRVLPTEPTPAYTDIAETKYKAGSVLHYMDFSKVASFADTGYFVTNDKEPDGFKIQDGELRIKTNASDNVEVMLTGNGIPKNIQDFTVEFKLRFVGYSTSYFCFVHSNEIGEDGKVVAGSEINTCFRFNGKKIDTATTTDTADDVKAFWDAVYAGKEITFTYSAKGRQTNQVAVTCGGKTITWTKTGKTESAPDSLPGFMVGRGSDIAFSSVKVVAGVPADYAENGLIWPETENALVQNVSANAIDHSPTFQSTQVSAVQDGKYNVRFVGLLDSLEYPGAGYELTVSYNDGEKNVQLYKDVEITTVYSSLVADGATVQAPTGMWYLMFDLKDVPTANSDYTFTLKPYTVNGNGTRDYGKEETVSYHYDSETGTVTPVSA